MFSSLPPFTCNPMPYPVLTADTENGPAPASSNACYRRLRAQAPILKNTIE